MALARPGQNRPDVVRRQAPILSLALDPEADDLLLNAIEVQYGWELSNRQLRLAVKRRQLQRSRRPGYQPYYSMSAVVACFGQPKHPPFRPVKQLENDDKGGYQQRFDLDESRAA
jgi:hypothetical protein